MDWNNDNNCVILSAEIYADTEYCYLVWIWLITTFTQTLLCRYDVLWICVSGFCVSVSPVSGSIWAGSPGRKTDVYSPLPTHKQHSRHATHVTPLTSRHSRHTTHVTPLTSRHPRHASPVNLSVLITTKPLKLLMSSYIIYDHGKSKPHSFLSMWNEIYHRIRLLWKD